MACHVWHFFHCLLCRSSFPRVCAFTFSCIIHWRVTYIVPNLHRNWAKMKYIFSLCVGPKTHQIASPATSFSNIFRRSMPPDPPSDSCPSATRLPSAAYSQFATAYSKIPGEHWTILAFYHLNFGLFLSLSIGLSPVFLWLLGIVQI